MSDEMQIDGKTYISSKRASQISGYAQDYIGQLARKALIDAKRIGGLWYISMFSLDEYKRKAEEYKPEAPKGYSTTPEPSTLVFFDGKEYLSAAKAAQITGYAQDYVGQLGRSGKILSQQVGNRWYVEKESLLGHKSEKDRLLGAVQSEAVGLLRPERGAVRPREDLPNAYAGSGPFLNYYQDNGDLMPTKSEESQEQAIKVTSHTTPKSMPEFVKSTPVYSIPIKRSSERPPMIQISRRVGAEVVLPMPKKSYLPMIIGAAATIIIVISIGYASVLKKNSAYALGNTEFGGIKSLPASVEAAFGKLGDMLEPFLTRELSYERIGPQ